MKIQIRRNVFETNSSSMHTLTMCRSTDFEKWKNGEMCFKQPDVFLPYDEELHKIRTNAIKKYLEECGDFSNMRENKSDEEFSEAYEKFMNEINDTNYASLCEDNEVYYEYYELIEEIFEEKTGMTYDEWYNFYSDEYDTFDDTFEGVTAFGMYGNNY